MESVITWIGITFAALVAVAVSVAAWEHHRAVAGRLQTLPEPPLPARVPSARTVDVDVDGFVITPPAAAGDSADRRAALDQAMGRLSKAPAAAKASTARPLSWVDTEPMVGPGALTEPPRTPAKAPNA